MVFRLFIISWLLISPVQAQADCRDHLSFGGGLGAQGFTADSASELSDADLKVRIPNAAKILFDQLAEQAVDFTKLEKVLRTNWLVVGGALTEAEIGRAFSGHYVPLTLDFFSKLELVLAARPALTQEVREAVLAGLQTRIAQEGEARGEVQVEVQKVRVIDPRFEPTSTGAVFEPVDDEKMGPSLKDESGRIWSAALKGVYSNVGTAKEGEIITDSDAARACAKIGGRLPSKEDYEVLRAFFELKGNKMTVQGLADFHRIFPDMEAKSFWSSSVHPDYSSVACGLFGFSGGIVFLGCGVYDEYNAVRCVRSR